MEHERQFKGIWISKEIWLDERLNALEKVILAEIDSLDVEESGCFASNKYLADFCGCSETKVSTAISKLIEFGYIYLKSFNGRTRILKSRLSEFERQTLKICKADFKNLKPININNNKSINIDNNKKVSKTSFEDLINQFTSDTEERELLIEWLKVRKAKRSAMTDKAIELNLNKLKDCAVKSGLSVKDYLQEIICRGWQAFYVINSFASKTVKKQNLDLDRKFGAVIE